MNKRVRHNLKCITSGENVKKEGRGAVSKLVKRRRKNGGGKLRVLKEEPGRSEDSEPLSHCPTNQPAPSLSNIPSYAILREGRSIKLEVL